MNGYKKLMTSVLAQAMTDYIQAVKVGGINFSKRLEKENFRGKKTSKEKYVIEAMTRGNAAKAYIFDDSRNSEGYVFGFRFISSCLGIDPEKFRKRIKEKREDFWKDIYAKIKEI